MARPADEELIGRNVAGKFTVEAFIGGGAMGGVYKAFQTSLGKHVAVKVLHREFVTDSSFVARFEREAKAASLLDHPNLMRVVDYGRESDGLYYIAMELLDGKSLFQIMKDAGGKLENERIVALLRQTLAGLAVAHDQGIIHQNLKPENIIVLERPDDDGKPTEVVKVCDFGMAKMVTPESEFAAGGPLSSEKLTSHGVVVGTPDYMSPEQGKGEKLDARSDIYSVGVILYQMLTGRLPFSAETPIATLLRHVVEEVAPPSAMNVEVHPGLESVCLRALSKHREDRYQNARDMRAELGHALGGKGVPHPSAPPPRLVVDYTDETLKPFDLRAPPAPRMHDEHPPKSVELPPPRPPMGTPPQSHRIRAVEVLKETPPSPMKRTWTLVLAVIAAGAVAFVTVGGKYPRLGSVVGAKRADIPIGAVLSPAEAQGGAAAAQGSTGESAAPASSAARESPAGAYSAHAQSALVKEGKNEPAASDSASPAPLPSFGVLAVPEVPKIEGDAAVGSGAPAASAPPAASAAQDPLANAKVVIGGVRVDHVEAPSVVSALPSSRYDRCYKRGLKDHAGLSGNGNLHVEIDAAGHIGRATFAGTADLAGVGQCIADATIGTDIKHAPTEATGADVDLAFHPE